MELTNALRLVSEASRFAPFESVQSETLRLLCAHLVPVAKRVVRSCSCSSSCSISAATSTERSIVPYNIRRWHQDVTGFPIVLLLLAGLRCISGKVNSLPANRSEEDPCRPVFTLGISWGGRARGRARARGIT